MGKGLPHFVAFRRYPSASFGSMGLSWVNTGLLNGIPLGSGSQLTRFESLEGAPRPRPKLSPKRKWPTLGVR